MSLEYFHRIRSEIEPLLPARADRILEIGCSGGFTLKWLKDRFDAETVGIDGYEGIRNQLSANVDHAIIADLNQGLPPLGKFDLILALDVLEHLQDADAVLAGLREMLTPGGTIIVSLPNVSHLSVTLPLLLNRRFRYTDGGILDRTHIRFFVEETVLELLNGAGLEMSKGLMSGLAGRRAALLNAITFGLFSHYLAKQYIVCAGSAPQRAHHRKVRWGIARTMAQVA